MRRIALLLLLLPLTGCIAHVREENLIIPQPGAALQAGTTADGRWTIQPLQVEAAPGITLRGAWFHRQDAVATVLYFGGNGFVLSRHHPYVLGIYRALPVDVIAFDHRGYGASTGRASVDALLADGPVVYDAVRALPALAGNPLVVHGHSLGSFVAGAVAQARRLDGLVLESSATTAEDWVQGFADQSIFVRKAVVAPSLQGRGNAQIMSTLDEPVLIVVGRQDTTTPPAMSRALFEQAAVPATDKELLSVDRAGHMDASMKPAYGAAFERLLQHAQHVYAMRGPAESGSRKEAK